VTPLDVYHIMGLNIEGKIIDISDIKNINIELFENYRRKKEGKHHITLKSLEENITKSKEPDDHFIQQFVLFTIGIVLAPTTKHRADSKYLAVVENVKEIPKYKNSH
jgi:hypothetical protein